MKTSSFSVEIEPISCYENDTQKPHQPNGFVNEETRNDALEKNASSREAKK